HWPARMKWMVTLLLVSIGVVLAVVTAGLSLPKVVDAKEADCGQDPLGMVLLDIQSADTASFYHVSEFGVYVLAVREQSEAERAGVLSGDRLVSANGLTIESSAALSELIGAGQPVELTLARGAERLSVRLTLAD
ncbi:MAG: PDZ domain-containing protein, partial [Eubacteriales bacterium]|nr:PDZ domain-containing protein [Eubacteriales bacterium]